MSENENMKPHYWQEARLYLSEKDKILAGLITKFQNESLMKKSDDFIVLIKSIIGQQISVTVANAIYNRLENLTNNINVNNILSENDESLRSIGLSKQKVAYIKNIAEFFTEKQKDFWLDYNREKQGKELLNIKGVGPWTLEMFEIFYLQEADIFPIKDIGLIRSIEKLYGKSYELEKLSKLWSPYRTVATWHLWRSIDPEPVSY